MPSNITRRALKQDKFATEVGHTVDYVAGHRRNFMLYGGVALAVIAIVSGVFYYRNSQLAIRNEALGDALALTNAPVGTAAPNGGTSFSNDAAKDEAVRKALTKVSADYGGSQEAWVAEYVLASQEAGSMKLDQARNRFQNVADHANASYSSLAKLGLAQLDLAQNRFAEAETVSKDLMDHPTDLVSKEQATLVYAKAIGAKRPDEARKLLTSLANPPSGISSIVTAALADLPQK